MLDTYFKYNIPKCEDLEDIIKFSNQIKMGKELIRSKYPAISIEIKLRGGELYDVYYCPEIKGEKEEDFRSALSDFFKVCGTPQYVGGNCNSIVNEILQQYGKRVKGGVLNKFVGATGGTVAVIDNKV